MPKFVKILAIALGVLLLVLLAAAAYLAATFDPNKYKSEIVRLVQDKTQRTLHIPGDIELSFFPNIGAELGALSLSERNSKDTFAAVDSARVSLALLPLLSQRFVVDKVRIDGLKATIRRNSEGVSNIDDLLGPDEEEPEKKKDTEFDIAGVELNNANLVYDDRQSGRRLELSELNFSSGRIAEGVASNMKLDTRVRSGKPQADARVQLATGFRFDLEQGHYNLRELKARIEGAVAGISDGVIEVSGTADMKPADMHFVLEKIALNANGKRDGAPFALKLDLPQLAVTEAKVEGGKLSGELSLTQEARKLAANFRVPSFQGTPQAFSIPALEVDASVNGNDLDARAALSGALNGDLDKLLFQSPQIKLSLSGQQGATPIKGNLSTPLSVDLDKQRIDLAKLVADFTLPNPAGGSLALKTSGQAGVQLDKEAVSAKLAGTLDQSRFDAQLAMNGFAKPAYRFDIDIDKLDVDRYRKPAAAGTAKSGAPAKPQAEQAAEPIDLSALRELRADGKLRVGALTAAGIKMSNVRVDLRAASGKLELNPLAASLYGGSANGSLSVQATAPARFALRQNLTGIHVGPLLQDALESNRLEGRGNVQLDVTTSGNTVPQLKRGLNGTVQLSLKDGAVRGVNIAQTLRTAKTRIDALRGKESEQAGTGSQTEKTDFSELTGSFRIVNGVARNDDLEVKSPLLRVAGSGEIDIGAQRLDYTARTTVVSTLQGQGGPELQALKGVTLPVRLSGPFDAISWRVDAGAMLSELAKQKLEPKKAEAKQRVEKALDEEKAKVKEKLNEQLRGLFGR
ncbi:MAG TPA: AsmA family protein [Noviherbaspirillum sp.]